MIFHFHSYFSLLIDPAFPAYLNLDSSSLNKCPKPPRQAFRRAMPKCRVHERKWVFPKLLNFLRFLSSSLSQLCILSAYGFQIPLRPPQRREETPGWAKGRQLPEVRQMASSIDSAATLELRQITRNNRTAENLLSISSTSLVATMLLLYITVSACTTSSSPPGRRRPSLTEKITSSLQTRWQSIKQWI